MAGARGDEPESPVVLCYDGSPEAAEAIAHAGELLRGLPAIVVSVWKEVVEETLSTGLTRPVADLVEANKRARGSAERFAAQGARLAERAGFRARPLVVQADGPLWEAIERVAEEHDAKLIVCGTGRSGIKAALPGNLASALVNHASRPLLVVPSSRAAAQRIRDLREDRAPAAR
ncbi:MAG TPA: universal stress protein [Solirubrobacteraceae bacterium]|jgi:nucleotide-binding universal stress UspA family protein